MLIVFLVIGLIILGVGITIYILLGDKLYNSDNEFIYHLLITLGALVTAVVLVTMLVVGVILSGSMIIDEKIALYQEENTSIELTIETIVEDYKTYETNVFDNAEKASPEVLFTLYPELKSNELVVKQMDIYLTNNKKIKSLSEEKLEYKCFAWWLYFGG